jgi:hypothetical protein
MMPLASLSDRRLRDLNHALRRDGHQRATNSKGLMRSLSANQEIYRTFSHKNPLLVSILNQINQSHILAAYSSSV